MLHIKKIGAMIIFIFFYTNVFALDTHFESGFDQGMKTAMAQQGQANNAMQSLHPEKFIQNYNTNPKEVQFKSNFDAMKSEAIHSNESDPTTKSLIQGMKERHTKFNYSIDPNSGQAQEIQKKSNNIYDVITGQFGDCTKQTNCTTTYRTSMCEETPKKTLHYCNKILNINVASNVNYTDYAFTVSISNRWKNYASVIFDLTSGEFVGGNPQPGSTVASLTGRLPSSIDSSTLSLFSKDKDGYFTGCDLYGKNINIRLTNFPHNATLHFVIRRTVTTTSPVDQWSDDCTGFANDESCHMTEERCTDGSSAHVVQGLSVTRDCWEKETTYLCGATNDSSACEPLRTLGCEQIGSECENMMDGSCEKYNQTFRCPIKKCNDVGMICNAQTYCLNGDCPHEKVKADPDFQRAVSALSAISDASKSYSMTKTIFAGQFKSCDKLALGFLDCCTDEGWGKDHIANCTQDEKDLKMEKEHLQAVYVGQYCKKDTMGLCREKRKAYCVFPSKLARIIQEQGRRNQLNISFGDPEHADCRGISAEELSKLNLSNMDFSDFYSDIAQKESIEDSNHLNQRMNEKIQTWSKERTPHG